MPRYRVSMPSPKPPSKTFAYLAAFDNIRDWDPSVVSARRLDEGELRLGSAFEVVVRVGSASSRCATRSCGSSRAS